MGIYRGTGSTSTASEYGTGASLIIELNDVYSSMTPIDGQVLTYDTTNGWQAETHPSGHVTNHELLDNIGTNSHTQIDTHIADTTKHFTQASISITESQISDLGSYATQLSGLSDVNTSTATNKNFLIADGTDWESRAATLTDLSDVNTATVTNRNVLVADGTDFESRPLVEADISDLASYVDSDNSVVSGSDVITNMISLTQTEYNGIGTKSASTLYVIVG